MFGAASTGTARIPDLSFEGTLSRLCTQPGLAAAVATAPDRRATLGVVSLRHLAGHGAVWQAPDGSLAAVHGHVRVPVASRNTAAWVLESYRRDQQSLERLEGSYAIALWDAGDGSLVLTNDRFGLRNVYYTVVGAAVRFAPTVGALLPIAPRPRADLQGVADFLPRSTPKSGH